MRRTDGKLSAKALSGKVTRRFGWTDLALLPIVLFLSIPSLVWFRYEWVLAQDAEQYLLAGWHLVSGRGYTLINGAPFIKRGPLFPGLLGGLMTFLGRDTGTLALTVRLLALLNPLLAYLLVRRLASPIAALVAAAAVTLLGYTTINKQALNIDAVLMTAYLLSLLALMHALRRNTRLSAFLSGVALGAAILVKETALVNLPLALLAVLFFGWGSRRAFLHYLGVVLACLPWWAWVYAASGQIYLVGRLSPDLQRPMALGAAAVVVLVGVSVFSGAFDRFLAGGRRRSWTGWSILAVWPVVVFLLLSKTGGSVFPEASLAALRDYFASHLAPYIALWPLMPVAAGYAVWRAVKGGRMWRVFSISLLFQAPIVLFVTLEGWNQRQFLIPQTLLLCALAVLVTDVFAIVARDVKARRFPGWIAAVSALILGAYPLVVSTEEVHNLLYDHPVRPSGGGRSVVEATNMVRWMERNVPPGSMVVTMPFHASYLVFKDGGRHRWTTLGLDQSPPITNPTAAKGYSQDVDTDTIYQTPPRALWVMMSRDESNCTVLSYSIPHIMYQLRKENARYLMVAGDPRLTGLMVSSDGLVESRLFVKLHQEGRDQGNAGFALLERTGDPPRPVPTWMGARTILGLVRCERDRGPGYERRITSKFPQGIVLVPEESQPGLDTRAREALERIYRGRDPAFDP